MKLCRIAGHFHALAESLMSFAGVVTVLVLSAASPARALNHPGTLHNLADLNRMKANLNKDPWKLGYQQVGAYYGSLSYTMQGPFAEVGRGPEDDGSSNVNLGAFQADITAIYYQAVMWQMTNNSAYATKAISILNAWATTHTTWLPGDGTWSGLVRGDYGLLLATGIDILRWTYPGWTAANTSTANAYLLNMFWNPRGPWTNPDTDDLGAGNQGLGCLKGMMAAAIAMDDTAKFNYCVSVFNSATNCVSLTRNTLASGQNAESGRDQSHSMMEAAYMTTLAEIARKQGVDFFGTLGNRLLAVSEHWTSYNLGNDVPVTRFGPCNNTGFTSMGAADRAENFPTEMLETIYAQYAVRGGLQAPFTNQYRSISPVNSGTFFFNQETVPSVPPAPKGIEVAGGNAQAVVTWRPSLGGITYTVKRGTAVGGPFTPIAAGRASPNLTYVDSGLTNGTTYYYVVSAVGVSEGVNSKPVGVTPGVLALSNIGINTTAGTSGTSGGVWTVTGGGGDIGGSADSFALCAQPMTGDGSITARLTNVTGGTAGKGKIGIQMRNGTGALSASVSVLFDLGAGPSIRTCQRAEGDANMYYGGQAGATLPRWLRLKRDGSAFEASYSSDGVTWVVLSTLRATMGQALQVGFVVCGRSGGDKTATFDNVTLGNGNALTWVPDGVYRLRNRTSAALMIDNGGSTADGTNLVLATDSLTNNQRYLVTDIGGGYTKLMCVTGNKLMDSLGRTGNGSIPGQWGNSSSNNQQWILQSMGGGYFRVVNRANGLALDSGGQTASGSTMKMWSPDASNNLQWLFVNP